VAVSPAFIPSKPTSGPAGKGITISPGDVVTGVDLSRRSGCIAQFGGVLQDRISSHTEWARFSWLCL
jgi:hypothetical protein